MDTLLLWIARYAGFVVMALLAIGLLVLHLRLRNARTLSTLVSCLAGVAWLFFSDSLVHYLMPSQSASNDAEALSHLSTAYQVQGLIAAAIFLWFGVSFVLAALSCPQRARDAV